MAGLDQITTLLTKYTDPDAQVILLSDMENIIRSVMQIFESRRVPAYQYYDATAVSVSATVDSPANVIMAGFPNILHPGQFVDCGLSDGGYYSNTAAVYFDHDVAANRWGTEKGTQWYTLYALSSGANFTLKGMPFFRYSSQATKVITLRNTANSANIGYGFTTDELAGYWLYVISGTSKGLAREITGNNNNNTTGGTITYTGDTLTMTQGDWFVVLPDANFRWLGNVYNNASSNIEEFEKIGETVAWRVVKQPATGNEHYGSIDPMARYVYYYYQDTVGGISWWDSTAYTIAIGISLGLMPSLVPVINCTILGTTGDPTDVSFLGYGFPSGYFAG